MIVLFKIDSKYIRVDYIFMPLILAI
jgi:hypothetical protein